MVRSTVWLSLTDQLVVFRHFVSYGPERAATRHPEALLRLDMRQEPRFQVSPASDLVVDRSAGGLDRLPGDKLNSCEFSYATTPMAKPPE